jgi:chemotaxis protein methyltransferase CheR
MYAEVPGLSGSLFVLLRDIVHERAGIFYEESNRDLLAIKLSSRMIELGFGSFLDYYYLLKYDAAAETEWQHLVNALTVRETYFWREIDHVRTLVDVLAPQHAADRPGAPLRIWSAACATGEEPLTIAMALHQGGWFDRLPIEIYASDISPQAIAQARRGIYPERSFRNLPAALRATYFAPEAGGWRIAPEIHARVRWSTANLIDAQAIAGLATASAIFCRNVFIYFSEAAIRKTLRLLFERMQAPGYLFVGVSEPLLRLTTDFELREIGGAFVYVKPE